MKWMVGKPVTMPSVYFLDFTKIKLDFIRVRAAKLRKKKKKKLGKKSLPVSSVMAYVKHHGA